MTRERAKELLPIIQAYAEGKTIQAKMKGAEGCGWRTPIVDIEWLSDRDYRIKPEPREFWCVEHPNFGIQFTCRDHGLAIQHANQRHDSSFLKVVKVREVIE